MDNVATTQERVLSKYSPMSKQWTSIDSRSESPLVAEFTTMATASRSDIHDVTDCLVIDDTLTASAVIGTGQTGRNRPLLENSCKNIMGLVICT